MNNGPHLQNDARGDAYGPRDPLQVLAEDGSGLSVPPAIAPPHEPILFDKARDRNEYHLLQLMASENGEERRRRREKRMRHDRRMMALLIELNTQRA